MINKKNLKTINDDTIIKTNDVLVVYNGPYHDDIVFVSSFAHDVIHTCVDDYLYIEDEIRFLKKAKSTAAFNKVAFKKDDCFVVCETYNVMPLEVNNTINSYLITNLSDETIREIKACAYDGYYDIEVVFCIVCKDLKKHYIHKDKACEYFKLLKT